VIVGCIAATSLAWALYNYALPEIPNKSIPVEAWFQETRESSPNDPSNPLPFDQKVVDRGRERYELYCTGCHGSIAGGDEAVGEDLAPLPVDLRSPYVQDQTDGVLFSKISHGFRKHPPLADTVTVEDRWAIIRFLRFSSDPSRGWRA
jgi:hypothetical protein